MDLRQLKFGRSFHQRHGIPLLGLPSLAGLALCLAFGFLELFLSRCSNWWMQRAAAKQVASGLSHGTTFTVAWPLHAGHHKIVCQFGDDPAYIISMQGWPVACQLQAHHCKIFCQFGDDPADSISMQGWQEVVQPTKQDVCISTSVHRPAQSDAEKALARFLHTNLKQTSARSWPHVQGTLQRWKACWQV